MRTAKTSLLIMALGALVPSLAQAHFILQAPNALSMQPGGYGVNPYGGPQKSAPCGQNDAGFTTTGAVNNFTAGQTITLTILETVPHPGNYRVAIAQNMGMLPADPQVTAMGGDQCAIRAPVETNPTLPVIADGLFQHTASFGNTPQTAQVKLPDGFTCQNCVLQVIEYMGQHGAPCYYHHCATVNITANATADLSTTTPADMAMAETPPPPAMETGCSYVPAHASALTSVSPLLFLGLLGLRRRRRAN